MDLNFNGVRIEGRVEGRIVEELIGGNDFQARRRSVQPIRNLFGKKNRKK
jgi:hypothetical protein